MPEHTLPTPSINNTYAESKTVQLSCTSRTNITIHAPISSMTTCNLPSETRHQLSGGGLPAGLELSAGLDRSGQGVLESGRFGGWIGDRAEVVGGWFGAGSGAEV
ncbi:hypothetical protein BO78DRAFT_392583 [Aspergillus sclerotiicarbonarius CBS 121057]|uniref:Uncharacterized protein n=1 Tax=Aspergillus sclerotiicarbonarius (strain CBS 121057 / IBT 28362) TaxID=1448318 RepID=A0A319ENI9_ASPSB|nr:hypothetical protein BO78DRAFT_392583 [Aspergillus sclerotiicarbonarius CBS 121057]